MKHINPKQQIKRAINLQKRVRTRLKDLNSVSKNYLLSIDSPRKPLINTKKVIVEGWIIPKNNTKNIKLRAKNNSNYYEIKTGVKRLDVEKAHPDFSKDITLYSGFAAEFEYSDGELTIEVEDGKGFKSIFSTKIKYVDEQSPAALYNKNLTNNYPEHINLLENRKKYYYEDGLEKEFNRHKDDPRLMAIYLPQFHPFPENDKAWGKGFTEWSNVTSAQPRFIGHQQPILPKDLGFYDLRLESNLKDQINMAKKYGIFGFCFYYYWFSGKKIMDMPINTFLEHKEWDFNFAICWANENWTKRWDGRNNDIIVAQEYLETDPLNFIKEVEPILLDKRYIQEDGKPVLMVYRASELKEPARYAKIWRDYFKQKHGKDLQLVSYLSFEDQDPREYGFDAALDFAPLSAFFKNKYFKNNKFPYIDVSQKLLDINFSGVVADYRTIALNEKLDNAFEFPLYPCVTPSWDNDARKKGKGFIYQNSSPDIYAEWLDRVIKKQQKNSPLVFINAWNEWAEGAMLEPTTHMGSAILNRTAEVMAKNSKNINNKEDFPAYSILRNTNTKLAVIVHLYYTDLWPIIKERLCNINEKFDLFVTLNERDSDFRIEKFGSLDKVNVFVVPNRGRDVLPFLKVLTRIQLAGYEYFLKIHTKKSRHRQDGNQWFDEVLGCLLPEAGTSNISKKLDKSNTGLIGPEGHILSLKRYLGSNMPILEHLVEKIYGKKQVVKLLKDIDEFSFFGGTMFWARTDMFTKIKELQLMPDDFQSEHGQIDGTTAHALERLIGVVSKIESRDNYITNGQDIDIIKDNFNKQYKYAP